MDGDQANSSTNGTGSLLSDGQILASKISLLTISVLAIVGNATVVYLVARRPRLQTKTNAMVVSLAVSDLIVALFLIPSFFACFYVECDDQLSKLFYDVFLFTSVLNLCCITTDRFLAVTRPLKYHLKMTKRTVSIIICISWVIPAIVQLLPATWHYTDTSKEKVKLNNKIFYTIQVVVFTFIPCMIMAVAYIVIFNIALKQSRQLRHVVSTMNLSNNNSTPNSTSSTSTLREARATIKVFGTVLLVFICCWCLSAFRTIVINYELLGQLNPHLVMASRLLLVANSAINPIIYAFWKKDFKKEIRKLFKLSHHSIRPSSGTFRSHEYNNGSLARKASSVGSTLMGSRQDLSSPADNKRSKEVKNEIVNVAMADSAMSEIKEEEDVNKNHNESDPTVSPKEGLDNLAIEIDGMV